MNRLLTVTSVIEVGAGLALAVAPSMLATVLLGAPLDTPTAQTLGRVAGAALLALGFACWLARRDGASPAGRGLICALGLYNFAIAGVLVFAFVIYGLAGIGLWPGVALHTAMGGWCIACLRAK